MICLFRVAVMSDGQVIEFGSVTELIADENSECRKLVVKAGLMA